MFGLGTGEILILSVLVIILFGAQKIPQFGSSLAQGLRNFKKGVSDIDAPNSTKESITIEEVKK